jgi:broad specificity phosphatase PhoE
VAAPSIESNSAYRTLDYGDNKGKDETTQAQDKIKQEILNDEPIGKTGEKFSQLVNRVIPAFKKSLDEDPHNTAIVTHSSVIKALRVWEDMGRPDISEIKGDKLKDFAQRYVDMKPEAEGKIHTFTGDNGNDMKVIRHGETEDNVASEFREDNTQLTDKGQAQAAKAGDNLIKETGGNIPKLISSDMPRTLHTSEIIKQKLQGNGTLSVGGATPLLQREQVETGSAGSGRGRVEPSQQGQEPTGESGQPGQSAEEKGKDAGKEVPGESNEPDKIGTKRSINDVVRQRMGLSEVPIPKLGSDAEEMGNAKKRVDSEKSNPLDICIKS